MVPSTAWENQPPLGGLQSPAWAGQSGRGRGTARRPLLSYMSGEVTAWCEEAVHVHPNACVLHRTMETLQFEPIDTNPAPGTAILYYDVTCIA